MNENKESISVFDNLKDILERVFELIQEKEIEYLRMVKKIEEKVKKRVSVKELKVLFSSVEI